MDVFVNEAGSNTDKFPLHTGKQDASEATIELLKTIEHPLGKQSEILVDVCSYAGTGNVLKIQAMLHHCTDHVEVPKEKEEEESPAAAAPVDGAGASATAGSTTDTAAADGSTKTPPDMTYQALAVLGIALVAMGEEVGAEMCLRQFNHLVGSFFAAVAEETIIDP